MPATGDIGVLQFGVDGKWHYVFLTPGVLSTLAFDAGQSPALKGIGTATGALPIVPVPMASMSNPVKATIDAITAQGGAAWVATIADSTDVANAVAAEATARSSAISALTAGSPAQLDNFLETYNRFLAPGSQVLRGIFSSPDISSSRQGVIAQATSSL